jgi:hypothetical protein
MTDTLQTRALHTIGRCAIKVSRIADYDADLSHLGEYCNYRQPKTADEKLIHRASDSVLGNDGIWRDKLGRIVEQPCIGGRHDREYQFIFCSNGHDKIKYALQDARRLEDYEQGEWSMIGVKSSVYWNGVEIGSDSLWGIESDSGEDYFLQTERECAREAIRQAQDWLKAACRKA